jgi:hypothetical protein
MIALFESVHFVLKAEKRLAARGIPCAVVPTPKELSADCGMSLEIDPADADNVAQALSDMHFELREITLGPR